MGNPTMNHITAGFVLALALTLSAGAAQAATVYCPNGPTGSLVAPTSGRYVQVSNAASPGACYYQDGNLTNAQITTAGYTLLDKNGTEGTMAGALVGSGFPGGSTSGTWALTSNLWSSYSKLFLAFHFGNGGGSPDSFIVELESSKLSGTWALGAVAPARLNGLSNYYLLTGPGLPPPPPHTVSAPTSLSLVGLAVLGLVAFGRRCASR
jgi:hypothetical protein